MYLFTPNSFKCSSKRFEFFLILEAALMEETPTITFLEERARMVLQKNIENLYACGGWKF